MKLIDKINLLKKAEMLVSEDLYFEIPVIEFVLISKDKKRFIIGVNDLAKDERFIYKPHLNYKVTSYDEIEYRYKDCINIFHECIEGYILSCLNGSYEPLMIDINRHVELWIFIDDYIYEIDILNNGLRKYLKHCYESGITNKLLESYGLSVINDLFSVFSYLIQIKDEQNE